MKIVQIITGLEDGGAEHTLYKICKYDKFNEHIVISLNGSGKYFSLLKDLGIKVYSLNINSFSINKFFFLIKLLKSLRPDIVQTWLVHSDFIGGFAARLAGVKNIIWNIRYSNLKFGKVKIRTFLIIKLLAKISFLIPKYIVVVSKRAKKYYAVNGYDKKKLIYIPNGYDLSILKPNKTKKIDFRKKIKIKKNFFLIGKIARYDPKKDHQNLLEALSIMKLKNLNVICILVGKHIDKNNKILIDEIKRLKLSKFVKLLGQIDNSYEIVNALDINVLSSSYGEGFPNVVAESMACGTPCVVTDVGDAPLIVGKTGWIVPPNNPRKLAKTLKLAISQICNKNWSKKCKKARLRVEKKFDISNMITSYNKVWTKVCKKNNF
jgi:glycosyltransferase involved in cell wall biosynthesis